VNAKLLFVIGFVLVSVQWEQINYNHALAKVGSLWQFGAGECRDWHRQ
jgi:hypothetical protein